MTRKPYPAMTQESRARMRQADAASAPLGGPYIVFASSFRLRGNASFGAMATKKNTGASKGRHEPGWLYAASVETPSVHSHSELVHTVKVGIAGEDADGRIHRIPERRRRARGAAARARHVWGQDRCG